MQEFDDDLHVDLTALIDVIFMLVIFFIMTMSFTLPAINLNVPTSTTAQTQKDDPKSVILTIDEKGALYLNDNKVSLSDIENILKHENKDGIILYLDPKAPSQSFIDIADLSRTYTQGKLSIKAKQSGDNNE